MSSKETNWIFCVIAYFSILFLVPYFMDKTNEDYIFHANQGLNVFILTVANNALGFIFGGIGLSIITNLISLVILGLIIYGAFNAIQRRNVELPIIGQFRFLS